MLRLRLWLPLVLLLILQNCGQARSQRRDGLAKLEFSEAASPVFNFAKIYQSLYAQLLQGDAEPDPATATAPPSPRPVSEDRGRSRISGKPFHILEQLQQDFEAKWQTTTTVKPFSILQHLDFEQEQEYLKRQKLQKLRPNSSFHILEALDKDQIAYDQKTTSSRPFHVLQQLEKDLVATEQKRTTTKPFTIVGALIEDTVKKLEKQGFETQKPQKPSHEVEAPAEHKAELKPESRAKQSQKRRRKRIRRRRKRIRRRRKRTRRRRRKKRKKRRKKRKKKRHKGDKKKKKKGKRKRKKQQKPEHPPEHSIFQPGQVIFANPTKQPYYHHPYPHPPGYPYPATNNQMQTIPTALLATLTAATATTTTKKPKTVTTTFRPFSKIKYLLRHNSIFKKKKKEYLSHVGQVLYPFVKFVAFFTVLNPFTLGVFLITLISPAVFGFLGFVALSVLVKPFLHLVFGVKRNVDAIDRKRFLANKQAERLKLGLRPVTIHKHFYQNRPVVSTPPVKLRPVGHWRREGADPGAPPLPRAPPGPFLQPPAKNQYNPLLPEHRRVLNTNYDYG